VAEGIKVGSAFWGTIFWTGIKNTLVGATVGVTIGTINISGLVVPLGAGCALTGSECPKIGRASKMKKTMGDFCRSLNIIPPRAIPLVTVGAYPTVCFSTRRFGGNFISLLNSNIRCLSFDIGHRAGPQSKKPSPMA